jgi:hypothetical protein
MRIIEDSRFILIFLATVTLILLMISKRGKCEYRVILKDKEVILSRRVNFYENGYVDIRKCDGNSIIIDDGEIDTVKVIK